MRLIFYIPLREENTLLIRSKSVDFGFMKIKDLH